MSVIKPENVDEVCSPVEIPPLQWAQVFEKQGSDLQYKKIPVPQLPPDAVLVQIKYSGVCRSDLHAWKGDWPTEPKYNLVGGHEGTGVVVGRGKNVSQLSVGDRVGVQWINSTCGECESCECGDAPFCPDAKHSGYSVDGTFQQYCVCKATNAIRIPDGVPLDEAASILCAGVSVYKALKESNLKHGETVAIAGAGGGLGTLACQYAKALGYRVLALSTGPSKRELLVEHLGVDYFVDYIARQEDVVHEVRRLTGGGPHASIVVASAEAPVAQAIQYIRPKGTVVVVGLPKGALIKAELFSTVFQQKTIKGSYAGSPTETEEALALYAQKRFGIQYQIFPLCELPIVFEKMEQGKVQGRMILEIPGIETTVNIPSGTGLPLQKDSSFTPDNYNIGTFLASRLEELGVTKYFVVPGDFNLVLLDQVLTNPNLQMVGCCNELNAGYAADGYARSSPDRVAVVFVTFMVGGLSLLNAIAGAYSDRLRVIVVSGAPASNTFGQDSLIHHTIGLKDRDQAIQMFQHITTISVRLEPEGNPTSVLDEALVSCLENSLPVYIEIPCDISRDPCKPPEPLAFSSPQKSLSSNLLNAFNGFSDHWKDVHNAVIIIGPLVRDAISSDILISLLEKLGCPVFCQPDAKSLVPESHPQFQGTFWGVASDAMCLETVMEADLWVGLGTRWSDYNLLKKPAPRYLDLQPNYLRMPEGTCINDITLTELCDLIIHSSLTGHCMENYTPDSMTVKVMTNGALAHDPVNQPLTTGLIMEGIQSILRPNDTLIAETGDSWFNAQTIKLPDGAHYHMQMMYGSIGWSLPATLGSQLARPDGRTVLMIGDGSFQMTAQELSTMIRLKTNPVIFIFNNLGYRIESAIHDGPYNYISNWNYADFARTLCNVTHSLGSGNKYLTEQEQRDHDNAALFSMRIKTYDELLLALHRVLAEPEKLAVLECCIHPWDMSESLVRFGQGVSSN